MGHPFITNAGNRTEAFRWLKIAEKLLSARDLLGCKTFATRARDSDPTFSRTDEILAVVDTLVAGDRLIANDQRDWYGILGVMPHQGRDPDLLANQYRSLMLLLNPKRNKFPFAEQAFRLVFEAWIVLSNPWRKSLYDKEIASHLQPQQHQTNPFNDSISAMQQNSIFFGSGAASRAAQARMHAGESSCIGGSHCALAQQVDAPPHAKPMICGSTREHQNFMSFALGSNFVYGSGSGFESNYEPVTDLAQEGFSTFGGNLASASGSNHTQPGKINFSNVTDKTIHNLSGGQIERQTTEDGEDLARMNVEGEMVNLRVNVDGSTFWTTCPYCYYMYEYPRVYVDCTLRCQNCKRAFQAVVIPSPPPSADGQEGYFCCWGFLPFGFSMENWPKNEGAASAWTPFSPMFSCPKMRNTVKNSVGNPKSSAPTVHSLDDDIFAAISRSSEFVDDWQIDRGTKRKSNANYVKEKVVTPMPNRSEREVLADIDRLSAQDTVIFPHAIEIPNTATDDYLSKVGLAVNAKEQSGSVALNFGNLDLNVEFSDEADDPAPKTNQGNEPGFGEDEGVGFFEGLEEYLTSLPILNVVSDDNVVKAA